MKYEKSLNLECPHCKSNCQFIENGGISTCTSDRTHHSSYICTHCGGKIMIRFSQNPHMGGQNPHELIDYYPIPSIWKSRINLNLITDENVKNDFIEAANCFNYGLYNASMVIARRAIHQEMIKRELEKKYPNSLYQQLENAGISEKLKELLQKVKNFGNNGAHPDFCLYDEQGNKLEDVQQFAELSLNFLDKYFSDEYETDSMIASAPLSAKEIEENE
jgi:hypothetical protein